MLVINMKVNPIVRSQFNTTSVQLSDISGVRARENQTILKMYDSQVFENTVVVKSDQRFIVSLNSYKKNSWDAIIVVLCIYQTISIPLLASFYLDEFESSGFMTGEAVISIVFLIDIFITFRTTYIDNSSLEEVANGSRIMKNYLFSIGILFDAVAVIPFEFLPFPSFSLLRLLKIYKLFSLSNTVSMMKVHQMLKQIMKFLILLVFLLLYIHFTGCVFYLVLDEDNSWIPPEDYPNDSTLFFKKLSGEKYWISLYHAMFFVVGIHNGGESIRQYIFFTCFYIVGVIIAAVLLGYMTMLIRNVRAEDTIFNETYNNLNTAMKNLRIHSKFRYKIAEFFTSNYSLLKSNDGYTGFLEILPPSLVKTVNSKLLFQIINKNPIFCSNSKVMKFAIVRLYNIFHQPGEHVVSQFEDPGHLYFIANGMCNVEVFDEEKRLHQVGQLSEGEHFGEIGLLFDTECTATVITTSYTNLAVMTSENFKQMLDIFPDIKGVLLDKIMGYKDNWRIFLKNMIRKVLYFKKLDNWTLTNLMYSMASLRFDAGDIIVNEGCKADCIYFIIEGKVELFTHVHDHLAASILGLEKHKKFKISHGKSSGKFCLNLGNLPVGSCLFPKIFLNNADVMISVRAKSHVQVLVFTRQMLEDLKISNNKFEEDIGKLTEKLKFFDNARGEILPKNFPIDVIREHKYALGANSKVWTSLIAFKSAVLKIIAIKRNTRIKNMGISKRIVSKLKAMNYAEKQGNFKLAQRIANDEIPEDIVKVMHLLGDNEFANELLKQFAVRANDTSIVCDYLAGRLKSCRKKMRNLKGSYEEIDKLGASIEKLLLEAIRISSKHS